LTDIFKNDNLDPKSKQAGSIAVDVWGGSLIDFAEMMTEYSSDKEKRIEFGKRVKADLENRNYHLYSRGYISRALRNRY
jgi:hypothetical protein